MTDTDLEFEVKALTAELDAVRKDNARLKDKYLALRVAIRPCPMCVYRRVPVDALKDQP